MCGRDFNMSAQKWTAWFADRGNPSYACCCSWSGTRSA